MSLQGDFVRLKCDCGSEDFMPTVRLRYKAGTGTTTEPGQYVCAQCHTQVDNAYLIGRAKVEVARQELQQKAQELQEMDAAPQRPRAPRAPVVAPA